MFNSDLIVRVDGSVIQHGKLNNRAYLMKPGKENIDNLIKYLNKLAEENSYTKIFAKVPEIYKSHFLTDGYEVEASIPGICFMSKYFCPERKIDLNKHKVSEILSICPSKKDYNLKDFAFMECRPDHAPEMAQLYKKVFASYPFPIDDQDYILKTMRENIKYFGIQDNNRLVALSSSEIDYENQNAEMTDFATLPEFRGQ